MNKKNVLEIANDLIHGERPSDYGHPAEHLAVTGKMWGALIKSEIFATGTLSAETVSLMFAVDKIVREQIGGHKDDHLVDAAGYIGCVERIREYNKSLVIPERK